MKTLPELIVEVCRETHVPMAQSAFGDAGLKAIFAVMDAAKNLYQHVEPERIAGGCIVIFQKVAAESIVQPQRSSLDFSSLVNQTITELTVEVASDGRCYECAQKTSVEKLAKDAIVYQFANGIEEFLAGEKRKRVLRLDNSAHSQFAVPTLASVREALKLYEVESVRESTCYLFEQVWKDSKRIFFITSPEHLVRRSLTQFLRNRIGGDHDILPEQNVNEKNPVDIRVMPRFSNNRLMLIEIKWLGDSLANDGHITVTYRNARAQEGADQLANYLDEQQRYAPRRVTHGYYVIIDGRRGKLTPATTKISRENGLHYEKVEITFNPAHHLARCDFDTPYRMFARPVCS